MRVVRIAAAAALVASVVAPPTLADGRNPGSVLIYPVQRSSAFGSGGEGNTFFTVVCVTNTNTQPSTPVSLGGTTLVHYEYANSTPNPQDPCKPLNCTIFNRIELLTPADTLCVLTSCHNAVSADGQEGYLVVSAQDPSLFDTAWSHDYLVGSELVINGSGGLYSVNAVPFESRVSAGEATDVNGNGQLDFDEIEYEGVADTLYIDSFIALGGSQLSLLNLTGGPKDLNAVQFSVWNDNEFPLSATKHFNCWFDLPLAAVSPLFRESFLQNSTPNDPAELDIRCTGQGTYETGWARIDSVGVETPGGLVISNDGAMLGAITAGNRTEFDGGHLLWESTNKQLNGSFHAP